jgi:hypothetical protein
VFEGIEMTPEVKETIMAQIKRRLSPSAVKVIHTLRKRRHMTGEGEWMHRTGMVVTLV